MNKFIKITSAVLLLSTVCVNNVQGADREDDVSRGIVNKLVNAEGIRENVNGFTEAKTFVKRLKAEGSGIVGILETDPKAVERSLDLLRFVSFFLNVEANTPLFFENHALASQGVKRILYTDFVGINRDDNHLYALAKNKRGRLVIDATRGSKEADESVDIILERAFAYKTGFLTVKSFHVDTTIEGAEAIISIAALAARCTGTLGFLAVDKAPYGDLFRGWLAGDFTTQLKLLMSKLLKEDVSEMDVSEITQFISANQHYEADRTKHNDGIKAQLAATLAEQDSIRADVLSEQTADFEKIMQQAPGSRVDAANATLERLRGEQKGRVAAKAQAAADAVEVKRVTELGALSAQFEELETQRKVLAQKVLDDTATTDDSALLKKVKDQKEALKGQIEALQAAAPKAADPLPQ